MISICSHPQTPKTLNCITKAYAVHGGILLPTMLNFKRPNGAAEDLTWVTLSRNSMGSEVRGERSVLQYIIHSED